MTRECSSNNLHQINGRLQPAQRQATSQATTGTSTNDPTNTASHSQSPQHSPMEPIFMTRRPGRRIVTKQTHEDIARTFGDSIHLRNENHIRIFFQNVKGLSYTATGEDYEYYIASTTDIGADIVGMAETNTAWQHRHLRQAFRAKLQRHHRISKVTFSSPTQAIDPVPEKESFQAGGTITFASSILVPMVQGEPIIDPSGLGRWSGLTFRGKNNSHLSVITAYRVCKSSIQTAPLGSSFAREYEHHRSQGVKSPQPRKQLLNDLTTTIQTLQHKGSSVLVMMDSNGQLHDDKDIQQFLVNCDLADLHQQDPALSTYIGSSHRRIDHMFGCSQTVTSLSASGSLSYLEGPQSDHRGLFVDLDPRIILQQSIDPIALQTHSQRLLKTGNPDSVEVYQQSMQQYYAEHRMIERIQHLATSMHEMTQPAIRNELEKWDADQGRAMFFAEKQLSRPRKPYQWSPTLRNAGLTNRYWRLRPREQLHQEDFAETFLRMAQQAQQKDQTFQFPMLNIPLSVGEIKDHLNKSTKFLHTCKANSTELRYKCYHDMVAIYENDNDTTTMKESQRKSKIVQKTIKSEQCRAMYRKIRQILQPTTHGALTRIMVPRLKTTTELPEDFQKFLETTAEDNIEWDSILNKESIDYNLLRFNRNHFRAASASPCGSGQIHEELTFTSLSEPAKELLNGTIPPQWYGNDELLREFLTSFAIPPKIQTMPSIPTTITEDDVKFGFRKWKETTTTSPSGRHLGHYKAIITDEVLLKCLTTFLHITITSGQVITRWCNAVNIMIEKDSGKPKLNRLRIIHLFEADFNLFLKLQWGSRLVKRAVNEDLLHSGQHGSVPKRTPMDPIMLTELTNDLCRLLKHNLARFDNDASACYDRIIVTLGMLAARRCGMPENAVRTHASCLQFMKYMVKTIHGISEDNYTGTPFSPLFGTGQGSGASPAVWLTLVVILMNTLERVIPDRMNFQSPVSSQKHSRLIDAFVDDTSLGYTDPGWLTLETMVAKLTHIAQTWEKLLFYSGGALNLQKCSWYILFWDWKNGRPILRQETATDPILALTTQGNHTAPPTSIKQHSATHATRILGVHLAPNGDFSKQIQVLKDKAHQFALRLRTPSLTPQDVKTFHRTMYAPGMRYVLPALAIDEEELQQVQTQIIPAILNKLGHSSKTPTAIRHGPLALGGLDLLDLRTEMGISQLKYLRDAIYSNSETGRLLLMNIQYSQLESGISEQLLEHPGIHIPYLTKTWVTSLRQFLYQHNLTVTVTDNLEVKFRCPADQCIMNIEYLTKYTPHQKHDINLVRLHLQVITLSDMTEQDGKTACSHMMLGNLPEHRIPQLLGWPRQPNVTNRQKRLWKRYIASNFLRYSNMWKLPLTPTIPETPTMLPVQYASVATYLQSLPKWYQRLLFEYKQMATDLQIWREFRSRRRLTIATDGSLLTTAGTFGWKLTTKKNITLYQGAGPIDGPIETGSSTRSELGGFTAPLLLITLLARHWGMRHRCKFRWLVDSQIAINRVTFITSPQYGPTRQPDNSDYLSVIRDLHTELRRPLSMQWIKSHQDAKCEYNKLSPDAKHNVDADALATKFHSTPRARPSRTTAHLPATKVSISINRVRYYGNLDANIRFHINGGYMRNYLQTKHSWSNTTWDKIDMYAFGRHMEKIPAAHHTSHVKFVHDTLPLGNHKFKLSTTQDPTLKLCPCCLKEDEDHHHFVHCLANPSRAAAVEKLIKAIRLDDSHPYGTAMSTSLTQVLNTPTTPISLPYEKFLVRVQPSLETAITDQHEIGWQMALRGYLAVEWQKLASVNLLDSTRPIHSQGHYKIHQTLKSLHQFTRTLWLGRNEALHKIKEGADAVIFSAESSELRYFHSSPHLLPHSDKHYCNISLTKLLQSRPSVRRRWLRRVRTARAALLKEGRSQQSIRQYMSAPGAAPQTTQEHQHTVTTSRTQITDTGSARTITTQTRMTYYFTGRPPDERTPEPGNPSPRY